MITWFDLQLPWLKVNSVESVAVTLNVFPRGDFHKQNERIRKIIRFRNL